MSCRPIHFCPQRPVNYQSLSGDTMHLRTSPQGLGLYIVPAAPPFEPGVTDLFQFGMKHSTLARFRAALRDSGRVIPPGKDGRQKWDFLVH